MKQDKTPMIWYKFINYIKLPINIVLMVYWIALAYDFSGYCWNKIGLMLWFLIVVIAILYTILLFKMYYRQKDTFFYFIASLIIDVCLNYSFVPILNLFINDGRTTLFILTCFSLIWFIANFKYISKRKKNKTSI